MSFESFTRYIPRWIIRVSPQTRQISVTRSRDVGEENEGHDVKRMH